VKVGHFLAYAWLMFWYCQLYERRPARMGIALGLVLMGVALEYFQSLTPHRTFGYADMRDNALGVAAGWALGAVTGSRLLRTIEGRLPARRP
jgi:VanZ family protein